MEGARKINSQSDQEMGQNGHDRPKGCLSFSTNLDRALSLSEVFMGRAVV